jgi:hypothetical protein
MNLVVPDSESLQREKIVAILDRIRDLFIDAF